MPTPLGGGKGAGASPGCAGGASWGGGGAFCAQTSAPEATNRNKRNLFIYYLVVVLVEKKLDVRDGHDND